MNKQELIEWLESYIRLEERYIRLENKLYGVKGVGFEEKVSDNLPKTIVDNLHDLDKYKEKMGEILDQINKVEDNTLQVLLKYKYIDGYTLSEIASKNLMGYSLATIKRLHRKSIDKMMKMMEE